MRDRWDTGRTEAFSDGVFAIAITLLVLDLAVPEADFHDLWRGIVHQWPSYLAYATSFLTIGGLWLAHHGLFSRLEYVNRTVMRINLFLLMAVSFLPYPTRLVAQAIRNEDAERAAVVFYGATLLAIAILIGALWAAAARDRTLLKADVGEEEVQAILIRTSPNLGLYVVAIALAFLFPKVAAFAYLAIALVSVTTARGDRPSKAAGEAA